MKLKKIPLADFQARLQDCLDFFQNTTIVIENKNQRIFIVEGTISDKRLSRVYEVRIEYRGLVRRSPNIYINNLQTEVALSDIPHLYKRTPKQIQLCLTYPSYVEYRKEDLFSKNFFLWTIEWLVFFELFEVTKIWYGNGIHPGKKKL